MTRRPTLQALKWAIIFGWKQIRLVELFIVMIMTQTDQEELHKIFPVNFSVFELKMNESLTQNRSGAVVYYCSLGRGMDPFVKEELGRVEGSTILKVTEGKIFFTAPDNLENISLKTAERILILVYHQNQENSTESRHLASFNLHRIMTEKATWKESLKHWKIARGIDPDSKEKLAARLNVKISGSMRKIFKPDRLSGSLSKRLKYSTNMLDFVVKNYSLSIDVHISDLYITAGLALTSTSQASHGPQQGLRSTTASALKMCLAVCLDSGEFYKEPIKPGSVILDPMCGKGGILGAFDAKDVFLIGTDNDKLQVELAVKNNPKAMIILGDAQRLPFKSGSVDYIICDLPFGLKYSKDTFKVLVPNVLKEMSRLIKNNGRAVFLFARSEHQFLDDSAKLSGFQLKQTFDVMLGNLEAVIFVLKYIMTDDNIKQT